jgi:hypothetical protein|tara:strand:+ start:2943 stop:3851 length:909 start_codon:yes stop_codon:yes gene_type:complete
MAQERRKPIPPRQKELSKRLQTPYKDDEGRFDRGNPNNAAFDNLDRGNQISFKGDDVQPFSIGIKDIDEAITFYMKEIIRPSVIQNGARLDVPVLYGDSERWNQINKLGYLRDGNDKPMLPLLLFKRTNLTKERFTSKIDANNPNNLQVFTKTYNVKNAYSSFDVLNRNFPEKQFYATVIPDYVTLDYDVIVSTYFVEQNNKIIEAMNYASDSYWGDPEKFKFRARIDSFATSTEIPLGAERIVKTTFSIKLYGYIIPDTFLRDINAVKKFNQKTQINILSETEIPADNTKSINQRIYNQEL